MNAPPMTRRARVLTAIVAGIAFLGIGAAGGVWWAQRGGAAHVPAADAPASSAPDAGRKVLYWHDPMVPNAKFDKPGKSPFMDMALVPRYADDGASVGTLRIDPAVTQNLGLRLARVTRSTTPTQVLASGEVAFNEREVSIVQARSGGFVERVAALAPGDVIAAGSLIAELLVPEWAAAQREFLALRSAGEPELADAARERMRLAGMPEALIREVEASGATRTQVRILAPRSGVIQELAVRSGMTLAAGQTLARINGIASVWLEVAVPEAMASQVQVGQMAQAELAALPGRTLEGRVTALLPALNASARTLRVRVELPNPDGRLRPGLSGQVSLQSAPGEARLAVPSEAVIRTGRRNLVILAEEGGRFRPVEVVTRGEAGGLTRISSGLTEGQQVVASGQFLIDSEASLAGITAQGPASAPLSAVPALHEADATVEAISATEATLTHGAFESLHMPGMTMPFPLADAAVAKGIHVGDKVRVGVRESASGLVIERLEKQPTGSKQ